MRLHIDPEVLSAYLDGQVTAEERADTESHLAKCPHCRGHLADLERAVTLLQVLTPVGAPSDLRAAVRSRVSGSRAIFRRLWPASQPSWRPALAAAAIVVVGVFSLNLWQRLTPLGTGVRGVETGRVVRPTRIGAPVERAADGRGPGIQSVGAPASSPVPFQQQVIRTATMEVRVEDFEEGSQALMRIAEREGGFVATSTIEESAPPSGTFTLRMPASAFGSVVEQVLEMGDVVERRVSGQDVTEEFVDLRARIRNLQQHERQLLSFMNRATRVSDLLAIEQELAGVRGEIEGLTGRVRFLSNRIDLATVEVTLHQR